MIQRKRDSFLPSFNKAIIAGAVLCILSPVTLIVLSAFGSSTAVYGVVILLAMVTVAVYSFVYFSVQKNGFLKLLREGQYSYQRKEENKLSQLLPRLCGRWQFAFS